MPLVNRAVHFFPGNFESGAGCDCFGRGQMQARYCCERLFSDEVFWRKERYRGLLPGCRYNRDFCAALLKVKHRICRFSLRKEVRFGLQFNDFPAKTSGHQKVDWIK